MGFIGDNFGGKTRQDIRPVQIPGNMAEPFRFTLGAQRFARLVQPFQRGIGRWANFIHDTQRKTFRQLTNDQSALFFFILCPRLVVHVDRHQGQIFAIQAQGHIGRAMTDSLAHCGDHGFFSIQVKGQVNISNLVIRRTIVVTVFGLWLLCHKKTFSIFNRVSASVYSCCVNRATQNVHLFRHKHPFCYIFITRGTNCPRPERELMV